MLYKFSNLANRLTQLGFPEASEASFRVIRRDLTQEEQAGNVEFKSDGVYLTVDGKQYKGFMYLKLPDIQQYGVPKFHITNCQTILAQKAKAQFDGRYFWHNSNKVTLTDRATRIEHENVNLDLCGYCRNQTNGINYRDTEGFFSELDKAELLETISEIELDMFGRPLNWDKISKEYRTERNYTCEKCGFGGEMLQSPRDREFIHTDHIVAWELANMRRNNLQCLCILCHSQKDEVHRLNFLKPGMQKRLKRFLDKYRQQLEELGNTFL